MGEYYDKNFLNELFRLVDFNSILVIDPMGEIRRLYCPFNVIALVNFPEIKQGDVAKVEAIRVSLEREELYIIGGEAYLIRYFRIILKDPPFT